MLPANAAYFLAIFHGVNLRPVGGRTKDQDLLCLTRLTTHELRNRPAFGMPGVEPNIDSVVPETRGQRFYLLFLVVVLPGIREEHTNSGVTATGGHGTDQRNTFS